MGPEMGGDPMLANQVLLQNLSDDRLSKKTYGKNSGERFTKLLTATVFNNG
jgi:hypothetical protein